MSYRSFNSARKYARSLKCANVKQWYEIIKKKKLPSDIPANANGTYKNKGWKGWGDFLGNFNLRSDWITYRSLRASKKYLKKFKLKSYEDYRKLTLLDNFPKDIPKAPWRVYKNKGWKDMGNYLGNNKIQGKIIFLKFDKAKEEIKKLNLKSAKEYHQFKINKKIPENIPYNPKKFYKSKWKNWEDYLGFSKFLNFKDAKKYVKKLNINSGNEWFKFSKEGHRPSNIPFRPPKYYIKEWRSWDDFLGKKIN